MDHGKNIEVIGYVDTRFSSNTYLLLQPGVDTGLVIDPGVSDPAPLMAELAARRRGLALLALTHEHHDHVACLERLRRHYRCPVVCSPACSRALADPKLNLSHYLDGQAAIAASPAEIDCLAQPFFAWGGVEIRFFPTPGHSPGSACIEVAGRLFSGDTLLPEGKRVTNLPGGDAARWQQSRQFLLDRFAPDTAVYPGHGRPFPLWQAGEKAAARGSAALALEKNP